jgi:hypothetical protein
LLILEVKKCWCKFRFFRKNCMIFKKIWIGKRPLIVLCYIVRWKITECIVKALLTAEFTHRNFWNLSDK